MCHTELKNKKKVAEFYFLSIEKERNLSHVFKHPIYGNAQVNSKIIITNSCSLKMIHLFMMNKT